MLGRHPSGSSEGDGQQDLRSSKAPAAPVRRHRPKRVTGELSKGNALELLAAIQEAILIGLPFNVLLTINLEQGSVSDCVVATGRFLTYYRQWVRSRGHDTAHVWCQERGPTTGQHVHILLHLPRALAGESGKRHRGWLKRCGAVAKRGLIHSRPIGKSFPAAFGDQASQRDYLRNLRGVTSYILKQVADQTRSRLEIERIARRSMVIGKRSGTSQNIGRKARGARGRINGPQTPWSLSLPKLETAIDGKAD